MAIIFIPGIKGTELIDTSVPGQPSLWPVPATSKTATESALQHLSLDHDGKPATGHAIAAGEVLEPISGCMLQALRETFPDEDVMAFGYDWRLPIEQSAYQLQVFIDDLAERRPESARRLHFVTHSMGGLLLRQALGANDRLATMDNIGRIIFIAPPFRGSLGSLVALSVGEVDEQAGIARDDRDIVRSFPAVYQMIPSWPGALIDATGNNLNPFDMTAWPDAVATALTFRPDLLRNAEAFVRTAEARASGFGATRASAFRADNVLVLCGIGHATPESVPLTHHGAVDRQTWAFDDTTYTDLGDARVPLVSAAVTGMPLAAVTTGLAHAGLCNDEAIIHTTLAWLAGDRRLSTAKALPDGADAALRDACKPWDGDVDRWRDHVIDARR